MSNAPRLADFRRIVVKVGSSLLVDASAGRVKEEWLASLAQDIAALHGGKRDLLVVSSARLRSPASGRRFSRATASRPGRCW
jgi:glutamate 5-kinase